MNYRFHFGVCISKHFFFHTHFALGAILARAISHTLDRMLTPLYSISSRCNYMISWAESEKSSDQDRNYRLKLRRIRMTHPQQVHYFQSISEWKRGISKRFSLWSYIHSIKRLPSHSHSLVCSLYNFRRVVSIFFSCVHSAY